jgi:hypothetical protein
MDLANIPDDQASTADLLLVPERYMALRQALVQLPPGCQRLLALLIEDRPFRMPRSAPRWASRSAASAPLAAAARISCAASRSSPP